MRRTPPAAEPLGSVRTVPEMRVQNLVAWAARPWFDRKRPRAGRPCHVFKPPL